MLERDGYMILPQLLTRDEVMMMRGVILNHVLDPEPGESNIYNADPMDPMNTGTAEGRAARFRKLANFGHRSPVLWHTYYTGQTMMAVMRHFLGDDILLKFSSVFMKPARTGSATPWHQDNGLWRDGETEPANIWMAVDPATKENGCLQVIPGSHREPIVPHVLYEGGLHGEIPREEVERAKQKYGVHHIELEPGSAVFWHSNLYHYSPPNTSDRGRIAAAAVYCTPALAARNAYHRRALHVMEKGKICPDYPPKPFTGYEVEPRQMAPYPKVEDTAAQAAS